MLSFYILLIVRCDIIMKHMYIHIPFCSHICSYCDFCKIFKNGEIIDKYLYALKRKNNEYYNNEEMATLYIGGGTPSFLNLEELIL